MNIALLRTPLRNIILSNPAHDLWLVTVNGTTVHTSSGEAEARRAFDNQLVGAPQKEAGQG